MDIAEFISSNDAPFLSIMSSCADTSLSEWRDIIFDDSSVCNLFICTDDRKLHFFRVNAINGSIEQCNSIPFYKRNGRWTQPTGHASGADITEKFEGVFFEAQSFIRDTDGLHPDEALDELCKLIFAKIYDEKNKTGIFCPNNHGNIEEYSASIRKLYRDASQNDENRQPKAKHQNPKGAFSNPIRLSSVALSEVSILFERFSFTGSDMDIKARAFQSAYLPAARSGMGQFFTPIEVIRFIVAAIDPRPGERILDPFCGSAHFLTEATDHISRTKTVGGGEEGQLPGDVRGIEKSERMVRIGMTDMLLHGNERPHIHYGDALLPFSSYLDLSPDGFDVVMTNPPFGSTLTKESSQYLGKFDLFQSGRKTALEVLGLERSVQFLRDGGRLGIVLPDSVLVNRSNQHVRDWIMDNTKVRGIIGLPSETFAPFGANIKTSVLLCTKSRRRERYDVFTARMENIGYEASGKQKPGSDASDVLSGFRAFIGREGWQ
ncbi:MAG: N-6 DNA methylase [Methanomassiliicoccaceae archaeon]|nr:N-6 DNA methylase [Methanomassiliicoccaceae archaeon]